MHNMKWLTITLALVVSSAALAQPAASASSDADFLAAAMATNRYELALGRVASSRAGTPSVQALGQKMLQKHTELGQQLEALAHDTGVVTKAELSPTEKATVARLTALPDGQLEAEFQRTIDDVHRRELALYRAKTTSATSPRLRALVERRVTALQKSVSEAEQRVQKRQQDW